MGWRLEEKGLATLGRGLIMFIVPFDERGIIGIIFFLIGFRLQKEMDIIDFWYIGSIYQRWDKKRKAKGKKPFWKLNSRKERLIPMFRDGWHHIKFWKWLSLFMAIGIWDILYAIATSVLCFFIWQIGDRK